MLKFLADVNVEKKLVDYLKDQKFDVLWIPDYDCALTDNDLLNLATKERRVLITNDTDFGEIVFMQKKLSSGIILIRIKDQCVNTKLSVLKKLLKLYQDRIEGNFIVISDNKIRIRSLE